MKGVSWLGALGLNPTLEALSAQLLVIVFALATYSVIQRNNRLMREDKAMRAAE
jgi:high-affinity iron transporter